MSKFYVVAISDGYHVRSSHDDLMEAITAIAKWRAKYRTTLVIRCGATGSRMSVQDCEDYMLPECRLTANESAASVWRRLAA